MNRKKGKVLRKDRNTVKIKPQFILTRPKNSRRLFRTVEARFSPGLISKA